MCSLRFDEAAFRLIANPWFDRAVITTIIVNCVFLALNDPTKESDEQDALLMIGDYVFSGIFTVELLIKWLALGLPAYFRDKWNWVDFIVVLESTVSLLLGRLMFTSSLNISALRALRVLRPLRAITFIPQVKLLFETVINSFKVVSTLLLCVGCVMLFFGNVGYTYWADALQNTCVNATTSAILDEGLVCGRGYGCPTGYVCSRIEGFALNHGVTGYYDIWHALLQSFQVVSLDGWQAVMWHTQDAAGTGTWVFFVVLLFVGNVLLVSMFPAIISTKLEAAIERQEERRRKSALVERGEAASIITQRRPASEFEVLLNEYSKAEAEEIASIERFAAVKRGDVPARVEEEPEPPPWTPFPEIAALKRLRKAVLVELGPFSIAVYVVIFLNAFILCLDHAGASRKEEKILATFNEVFSAIFVLEIVVKLGLLGPFAYFTDGYNVFDFAITWIGLVEITVQVAGFFTGLRVIRIFRIARVLRLASLGKLGRTRFNPSPQVDLGRMVGIVTTSVPWVVNIYIVTLLLMFTFAVLGMQFFGGALPDLEAASSNTIRFNYNSFGKAAATLVDLLTGNVWSEIMIDTVGATKQHSGIIFYVLWLVLSRWLVVAMIGTVLFYRVDVDTGEYLKVAAKNSMHSVFALEHAFVQCHKSHAFLNWRRRYEEACGNRSSQKGQIKLLEYTPPAVQPGPMIRFVRSPRTLLVFGPRNRIREFCTWISSSENPADPKHQVASKGTHTKSDAAVDIYARRRRDSSRESGLMKQRLASTRDKQGGRTSHKRLLGLRRTEGCWTRLLSPDNLHHAVRFVFAKLMVIVVIIMMVIVSQETEIASGRRDAVDHIVGMKALESLAVVMLLAEVAVFVVARGLIFLPGAYLRHPSSTLDFCLAILSGICLWGIGGTNWIDSPCASAMTAARALLAVRLMRVARLFQGLSAVFRAIQSSGRALCLAAGIMLFFWVQWAIIGLQVWEGALGYCSDETTAQHNGVTEYYVYKDSPNAIESRQDCEASGFQWKNAEWNFDSFSSALHSVLITFTLNGWQKVMFSTINARVADEGLNGMAWNNAWAAIYFLGIVLTSVVLVLLVVGVVFSMYLFINLTSRSGQRLASLKQAFWTMYEAKLMNVQPDTIPACPRDAHRLRRITFKLTTSSRWGLVSACLIGSNLVVRFLIGSGWIHYREAPMWIHVQEALFAIAFVAEWASRTLAFGGVRAVTRSPFQVADLLATLTMTLVFVDEVIFLAGSTAPSPFWIALEAMSMIRLVRLGHIIPEMQELLLVAVKSSDVVLPLLVIFTVVTYIWSVAGVLFFGNRTYLSPLFGNGTAWATVNRHRGFDGVGQGMLTLLGVATTPGSDGWVVLMHRYEDVTPHNWKWAVVVFFSSYAILTRFLLANLFMMTLLFKYKTHSHDKVGIAMEQVNQFRHAWTRHAYIHTKAYHTIYAGQLIDLLRDLPPPLGVGPQGSYYDCQILAKKVLCAMGVDAVQHVLADHIQHVLTLSGSPKGGRRGTLQEDGLGFLYLEFAKVLVAVHRILIFGVTLEDERQMIEDRTRARNNLSVLKLGVHRFLAARPSGREASRPTTSRNVEDIAVANCSLLRTQLPATFMARSLMALTADFMRWKDQVELRGYDDIAHGEGLCLQNAIAHELDTATAAEQLTAKLIQFHVEDRRLFSRLTDLRQHVVTLRELRGKVQSAGGEFKQISWEPGGLSVQQVIEDEQRIGVTALCASADGVWAFCTTQGCLVNIFKRERLSRKRGRQAPREGQYALVQRCTLLSGDRTKQAAAGDVTRGLCVTCSPDGSTVAIGCLDSTIRVFAQNSLGLRRAVHATRAEGSRRRRPTISYKATFIGEGHRAAVKSIAWLEPGYLYTGGADGTVRMWRSSSPAQPLQSIDVCRSIFSRGVVECIAVWRTTYDWDIIASCVDIDDTKDITAPIYVLAGDGEGCLSVLPSRTDSKFFAIDIWKACLRQQVDGQGGKVMAVEVAWGLIYTASGSMGFIKAWEPRWEDKRQEKLRGLAQVGEFPVHSGAVCSIVHTKGLMFSAATDLSIVTWHPPQNGLGPDAVSSAAASAGGALFGSHDDRRGRGGSAQGSRSTPHGANASVGKGDSDGEEPLFVTHHNEPGVVVHSEPIVGLTATRGALLSADLGGRLVVRAPTKFVESYRVQSVPEREDIEHVTPLALDILKARGQNRRPVAKRVASRGVLGTSGVACETWPTLTPQASMDHILAVRFLLKAKAKRRLKEDLKAERQRAVDRRTAEMFAKRYKTNRRRTLLRGVSSCVNDEPQHPADASKIADMDDTPKFLESADLQRLADEPEVYLALLVSHFFPSKDLAGASTGTTQNITASVRSTSGGNQMRCGTAVQVSRGAFVPASRLKRTSERGEACSRSAGLPPKELSNKAMHALERGDSFATGGNGLVEHDEESGRQENPVQAKGNHGCEHRGSDNGREGRLVLDEYLLAEATVSQGSKASGEASLPAQGFAREDGAHQRSSTKACRSNGDHDGRARNFLGRAHAGRTCSARPFADASDMKRSELCVDGVCTPLPDLMAPTTKEGAGRHMGVDERNPRDDERSIGRSPADAERDTYNGNALSVNDHPSDMRERQRPNAIVHVPLTPQPGTWTASVDLDASRNVAWILTEALRMYEREHLPLRRHAGLARKPHLVHRQASPWPLRLLRGDQKTRAEWSEAKGIPSNSPIRSCCSPGEEFVVLAEGFDPAVAFEGEKRPSVCAPPPSPYYSAVGARSFPDSAPPRGTRHQVQKYGSDANSNKGSQCENHCDRVARDKRVSDLPRCEGIVYGPTAHEGHHGRVQFLTGGALADLDQAFFSNGCVGEAFSGDDADTLTADEADYVSVELSEEHNIPCPRADSTAGYHTSSYQRHYL